MIYHIVAGEEMKKLLRDRFVSIPFNEDMSKGGYSKKPFSDGFIKERSEFHKVTTDDYLNHMAEFLSILPKIKQDDTIHLYFGDDPVCKANSNILIEYFIDKVDSIFFHLMNEYKGIEISVKRIK